MLKLKGVEVSPPELTTVIWAVPFETTRLAGTATVSLLTLTTVVVSRVPFHIATAPERK
jgi:hypothetical protein